MFPGGNPEKQGCQQMEGEAHNIIEAAVYAFDGDCADPFLDSVGACLVHRPVAAYIFSDGVI